MQRKLATLPDAGAGQLKSPETLSRDEFLFVTSQQLAARLQVSIGTLRNWRESGKLPFIVTPGRSVRFHLPSVEQALLRAQRGGPQ
jgi:excisionase family DNA binding protein